MKACIHLCAVLIWWRFGPQLTGRWFRHTNRGGYVDRCLRQVVLLTDTLRRLWAWDQPWIFPQANGGASINIHQGSCDLQWERPSQHSLGGAHRSPHWHVRCLHCIAINSLKDTVAPNLALNINTSQLTVWSQHALTAFCTSLSQSSWIGPGYTRFTSSIHTGLGFECREISEVHQKPIINIYDGFLGFSAQ